MSIGKLNTEADLTRFIKALMEQTPANSIQGLVSFMARTEETLKSLDERLKKGGL